MRTKGQTEWVQQKMRQYEEEVEGAERAWGERGCAGLSVSGCAERRGQEKTRGSVEKTLQGMCCAAGFGTRQRWRD